jgi:glyoxylase-like metal-dependent hydrolase (beta-lactamase superfamily II)
MTANTAAERQALEAQLHYPFGDALPAPGTAMDVAPGVRWVRMALPFALDHVNLWLLQDRAERDGRWVDGWAVVDCCIDTPESRAQWDAVIDRGLDGLPILRVVVTHMHPDHIGLAHWLCQRFDAPLHISATDYHAARVACASSTGHGGDGPARFFAAHGLADADALAKIRARTGYYASMVPAVPSQFTRLLDGALLDVGSRRWSLIAGYGHAPEHIALHDAAADVLVSGDMVLPRISTNVSVFDTEPEADPLSLFLASLERYRPLPASTLVLPSHGKPFRGLHTRLDQLHAHHRDRLSEVLEACATAPQSAADILPVLFPRALDLHQTTFALGEALAHLHTLWRRGSLRRQLDAGGVWRFGLP